MADHTGIEWADASWNPVAGCTRVSAECDNCYAVGQSYRLEAMGQAKYRGLTVLNPAGERHFNGVVRCDKKALTIPLGWRKPRRIFVNSMSDLFHREVPFEFIDRVFAVMALCPAHRFLVLTKRAGRMREYFGHPDAPTGWDTHHRVRMLAPRIMIDHLGRQSISVAEWKARGLPELDIWPLPNVWLGVSAGTQAAADERVPDLLATPAAVRFVSAEPLLEAVDFSKHMIAWSCEKPFPPGVDWIIVGGESGKGARPCNVAWILAIVEQCRAAGVQCFVKQLGKRAYHTDCTANMGIPFVVNWPMKSPKGGDPAEWPADLRVREFPA